MNRSAKLAAVAGIFVVGAGLYFLATPACACLTPDQAAHAFLRADMEHVLEAQQAFLAGHKRYARTLDELGLEYPPAHSEIRFAAVADSSLRLEGVSLRWPAVSCVRQITSRARAEEPFACTGHAGRR